MARAFLFNRDAIKEIPTDEISHSVLFRRDEIVAVWPARAANGSFKATTLPSFAQPAIVTRGPRPGGWGVKREIHTACDRLLKGIADGTVELIDKRITTAGIARQLLDGCDFDGSQNGTVEKYIRGQVQDFLKSRILIEKSGK